MERKTLRIAVSAAVSAAVLIVLMACMQADSFAGTYEFQNPLYEGQSTTVTWPADASYDSVSYAKITTSKKGRVTFTADFGCYVSLCNSNGDVISTSDYESESSVNPSSSYACFRSITFGVKKGATYYLKIKNRPTTTNSEGKYVGTVKWSGTKYIPGKAGKKKSKASTLKRKKTRKGLIVAGDKKAKWYKISTKKKSFKIYFRAKTNDEFKVLAYYKSGGSSHTLTSYQYRSSTGSGGFTFTNPGGRKTKVYLKVVRVGKSSGSYTLKWK